MCYGSPITRPSIPQPFNPVHRYVRVRVRPWIKERLPKRTFGGTTKSIPSHWSRCLRWCRFALAPGAKRPRAYLASTLPRLDLGPRSPRGRPGLTLDPGRVRFFPGRVGWRSEDKRFASACSARPSAQPEVLHTALRFAASAPGSSWPPAALHFYPPRVGLEVGPGSPSTRAGFVLDPGRVGWRSEGKCFASACSARPSAQPEGFAYGAPRRRLRPGFGFASGRFTFLSAPGWPRGRAGLASR